MFVTPYNEDEVFPSDIHINQNPGGEDFGLQKWVNRDENVRNADVVCWPCFGVTHISRPEDWPIMPVEILRVHLKPSGFFDVSPGCEEQNAEADRNQRNPGLDVPSKADSQSRHAVEAFGNLSINGQANGNGHASDEEVRETVNGEVRMGAGRVNGVNGCCGRS